MQIINKIKLPFILFFRAIPQSKSNTKIIFALSIIFICLFTMFDFLLPRETTTSYVYGHQTLEHGGNDVLMWSDNTASFVIDMGDSAYVLTDAEMFVFRTRILKRIDPIVLLNEDMIFPVVYNIRTSYFIMPIILILLCLFLIFNTLDKHEDGLIDPFCFLFILIMCFVNFALYFNPFLQFYTGKLE